jgi:hypothetical protein
LFGVSCCCNDSFDLSSCHMCTQASRFSLGYNLFCSVLGSPVARKASIVLIDCEVFVRVYLVSVLFTSRMESR